MGQPQHKLQLSSMVYFTSEMNTADVINLIKQVETFSWWDFISQ